MSGDDPGVIGITQRELLMVMRDDIRALRSVVDSVARDQALSVERRASMQRVADTITARLDSHEKAILDPQRWRDEAAGAIRLARWALGASLLASALMVLQSQEASLGKGAGRRACLRLPGPLVMRAGSRPVAPVPTR